MINKETTGMFAMLKKNEIAKSLGMILLAGSALVLTGCSDSDSNGSDGSTTPPTSAVPVPPLADSFNPNDFELTVAQFIYALSAKDEVLDQLEDVLWDSVFEDDPETDFPRTGRASESCQAGGTFSRNVTTSGSNPLNFNLSAELNQCRDFAGGLSLTGSFSARGSITESATSDSFDVTEKVNITALSTNYFQLSSFASELRYVESDSEESESGYYLMTDPSNISYQFSKYQSDYRSGAGHNEAFDFSVSGAGVEDYSLAVTGRNESKYTLTAGDDVLVVDANWGSETFTVRLNDESCGDVTVDQAISVVASSGSLSLTCSPSAQ